MELVILNLISVFVAIICTEAITQLVVHSEIFRPSREFVAKNLNPFWAMLVHCGYCFSVWAAFPCAVLMAPLYFPSTYSVCNLFIWTIVIHRLSNFLDDFTDKYLRNDDEGEDDDDDDSFLNADEHFGIIHGGDEACDVPVEPQKEQ